jgi:hypothetical protein
MGLIPSPYIHVCVCVCVCEREDSFLSFIMTLLQLQRLCVYIYTHIK